MENYCKGLKKWCYALDRNICQGCLIHEEPWWEVFHQAVFSQKQNWLGLILTGLNCLKCHFFFNILLQTSCQYIWFHISLFLTMKHQSMCSSLPALTSPPPGRLLRAAPKKINCFWNAGKPTASSHEQHRRGEKRQTAKLQFIISIWPYERNTLSWLNYCGWFWQLRPETCPLNPAPLQMSIVIN